MGLQFQIVDTYNKHKAQSTVGIIKTTKAGTGLNSSVYKNACTNHMQLYI